MVSHRTESRTGSRAGVSRTKIRSMIRLSAVQSLLAEEIAELPPAREDDTTDPDESHQRAAIAKTRSRAALVAAFDLVAILALFAFRQQHGAFLVLGGSEQGLFTLGVIAVAVHAGYRLGQRQKLGAVLRAWDSLPRRYDRSPIGRRE